MRCRSTSVQVVNVVGCGIYGFFQFHGPVIDNSLKVVSPHISGYWEMPQKITCSECGHLLYEGDILKSPQDIVKKFEGRCPQCGRKLDFSSSGVSIFPCEENR